MSPEYSSRDTFFLLISLPLNIMNVKLLFNVLTTYTIIVIFMSSSNLSIHMVIFSKSLNEFQSSGINFIGETEWL